MKFLAIACLFACCIFSVAYAQIGGLEIQVNNVPQTLTSENINLIPEPTGTTITGTSESYVKSDLGNFFEKQTDSGLYDFSGQSTNVQTQISNGQQTIVFSVVAPVEYPFGLNLTEIGLLGVIAVVVVIAVVYAKKTSGNW